MAIYRSTSIDEVVHDLGLILSPSDSACLSKSAVTQARQRCGHTSMKGGRCADCDASGAI
ncbi:transposase domain-containing protein [Pandoraea communis]|uniref:transposase domain-containing protein n=1 Tax=Pandoraea communis TaxID=2508297 RepID=UPI0012425902|nr:transposase domain-containing protein [Pandoraea communis]